MSESKSKHSAVDSASKGFKPEQKETESKPADNGTPKVAKTAETKREKFVRLIQFRMPKALKILTHIGNLSNKSQYEYTEAEATQVIADLTTAINTLRQKFMGETVTAGSWKLK